MNCIICHEKNNLIKICNCNYYVHNNCFKKWTINNESKCLYCKKKINESILNLISKKLKYIFKIYSDICQYDLYTGIKWEEMND